MSNSTPEGIHLELSVGCRNLRNRDHFSKSDPVCLLFIKSRGSREWKLLGKTERIKNSNDPEWAHKFNFQFYFEEKQHLRFAIYDWDNKSSDDIEDQDDLGTVEISVAELVRAPGHRLEKYLSPFRNEPGDCGSVILLVEELTGLRDEITFQFSGSNLEKKDLFSESDPYFNIKRCNPDDSYTLVYRSEFIKDNPNPIWAEVKINSEKLCNSDWNRKLKVEVYDYDANGSHDFIGEFQTCLEEMSRSAPSEALQWEVINGEKLDTKKGYKNSGTISLKMMQIERDSTFLDFIRGGLRLHFVVAVDFTVSNGNPENTDSLHYFDKDKFENQYSIAIRSIGDVFQEYDYGSAIAQITNQNFKDGLFIALGFGGLVHGRVSHCFPLNGDPKNPKCQGIDGVLRAYANALQTVPFSEPTCYAPVIDHVKEMAEKMEETQKDYVVLLLITDGEISDMEETKRILVENSHLPMSIILVGVGSGDMSNMNILDDDNRTMSYQGKKAQRDIVQFVQMSKFLPEGRLDPATFNSVMDAADAKYLLAKEVLAEIPTQIVQYMQRKGIKPKVPDVEVATRNLKIA